MYSDLKEDWCVAGAKALGLISKMITAPLWRLLEDPAVHIAEMGPVFTELVQFLELCSTEEQIRSFMAGTYPAQLEPRVVKDDVFDCLITPHHADASVLQILKFLFSGWTELLTRLVQDHLTAGKYHNIEEMPESSVGVTRQETKSVTKHNKLCEELFAHLDRLRMIRPKASMLTNEAHILFKKNRTASWLEKKTEAEKDAIIYASRKRIHSLRRNMHKKLEDISSKRKDSLRKKEEKLSRIRQKQFEKREELTTKIMYYGLWQPVQEIETNLSTITTQKEKLEALKKQINFRKTVLEQPVQNKTLYQFSSKDTGNFSVAQLTEHLK